MKRNTVETSFQKAKRMGTSVLFFFSLVQFFLYALFPATAVSSELRTNSHVINLSSHRIGFPGYHQNASYFSGYGLSYDYRFATHTIGWIDYYTKLTVGGFQQNHYQNGFYAGGSVGAGHQSSLGIEMYLSLGAAYQRSFDDAAIYKIDGEGNFEQVRDYGRSSLILPLAFELGYQFSHKASIKGLYIQYRLDIQAPFAPENNIPAIVHEYLTLGMRF